MAAPQRPACAACGAHAAHCPRCVGELIGARRVALRRAQDERATSLGLVQQLLDRERSTRATRADSLARERRACALRAEAERVRAQHARACAQLARGRARLLARRAELERARAELDRPRAPPSAAAFAIATPAPATTPPAALLEVCRNLAALRRRLIRKLLRTYRVEPDDDGDDDECGARRWRLLGLRLPPLTAGELERALEPAQAATALGHVAHLVALAARYACVRLPFPIAFCSSRSTIQLPADVRRPAAGGPSAAGGGGRGGRSLPLYPDALGGGGGGADGGGSGAGAFGLGSISMLGASGGGGGGGGGAAGGDEAQAQLARALLMLVANVHFLAVSCGLDRATPAAPGGGGGGARAADSAGTFDALATLVRLSAASTLCWELRTARWPGAGQNGGPGGAAADGARLPGGADEVSAYAWGGALMAAIVYDADGRGGGERGGVGASASAWRLAAVQPQHEWDLVERPLLPTPAQADDIAHWTRAMITDTIGDAESLQPSNGAARTERLR